MDIMDHDMAVVSFIVDMVEMVEMFVVAVLGNKLTDELQKNLGRFSKILVLGYAAEIWNIKSFWLGGGKVRGAG
jgi:hypothetical protein